MPEQFLLSAADSRLSSFGPSAVPLVTSFLVSELAAFVPLTNGLYGGGWWGWGGNRDEEREIEWLSGYS